MGSAIISAKNNKLLLLLRFSDGKHFPFFAGLQIVADRVSSPLSKSSVFHADSFHCLALDCCCRLVPRVVCYCRRALCVCVCPPSIFIRPSIVICRFFTRSAAIVSPIISAQPIRLFPFYVLVICRTAGL